MVNKNMVDNMQFKCVRVSNCGWVLVAFACCGTPGRCEKEVAFVIAVGCSSMFGVLRSGSFECHLSDIQRGRRSTHAVVDAKCKAMANCVGFSP